MCKAHSKLCEACEKVCMACRRVCDVCMKVFRYLMRAFKAGLQEGLSRSAMLNGVSVEACSMVTV